jgi:hypothetical protein
MGCRSRARSGSEGGSERGEGTICMIYATRHERHWYCKPPEKDRKGRRAGRDRSGRRRRRPEEAHPWWRGRPQRRERRRRTSLRTRCAVHESACTHRTGRTARTAPLCPRGRFTRRRLGRHGRGRGRRCGRALRGRHDAPPGRRLERGRLRVRRGRRRVLVRRRRRLLRTRSTSVLYR